MLAGEIYAPKKIRLINVPEPKLPDKTAPGAPASMIFQPELGCLCGSDLLYFEADFPEYPPVVGHSLHEMIGTVVETAGTRFRAGDRVLCVPVNQEGMFERFCVSEERAIALDPRAPEEQALLAQPFGTVIYALRKLPNLIGLDVAVVGQGPIGQMFCAALRNLGAREIIAIDKVASRLAASPTMGATAVVDSSKEDPVEVVRHLTGGTLADIVIEAVGHREQALNLCARLCRKHGRLLYFGVPPEKIDDVHWREVMLRNLTIYTSINPDFAYDFPLAMRWIAEGRVDLTPVITHRYPLSEIQKAFEVFYERRDGSLKVFVDFPAGQRESTHHAGA